MDLSVTMNYLAGIYFVDPSTAFLVGGGGTILKAEINNVNSIQATNEFLPNKFELHQNYPNPFNPTTSIEFGIREKGNVRISIHNILGEEIKVLLDGEKEAGYYSTDFNASDLPSGVYFYRMQTGKFIDTKKMILLR